MCKMFLTRQKAGIRAGRKKEKKKKGGYGTASFLGHAEK